MLKWDEGKTRLADGAINAFADLEDDGETIIVIDNDDDYHGAYKVRLYMDDFQDEIFLKEFDDIETAKTWIDEAFK